MSSPATLIAILEMATPQEKAYIASLLSVPGTDRTEVVTTVAPKKRSAGRPRKEKSVFVLPETADGSAPTESAYRLNPFDIKEGVCMARKSVCPDKRWSVAIYAESQCGDTCVEGSNLCKSCTVKKEKYDADPSYHSWNGFIDADPLPWQHMLGTNWAKEKMASGRLFFLGPSGGAGATGSDTETETATTVSSASKAAEKEALKIAKATLKAALKAEKEAIKAAKAAEKEAAKAAKAAEKEATKALKKAEKETKAAEKAALKAAKAADKTKKD
jgi:hypothetical protein